MGIVDTMSDWTDRLRKPITWVYCSAILFPLAFAVVATLIVVLRGSGQASHSLDSVAGSFYMILLLMLASATRSILPALLLWMLIARIRPAFDADKAQRYLGLFLLMAAVLFGYAKLTSGGFNYQMLGVAYLAVVLPRLALPSLRSGLHG